MNSGVYYDYFDLQVRFAEKYAALTVVPLSDAISTCTNLRRRFGWWGPSSRNEWAAFLVDTGRCSRREEVLQLVLATYDSAPRQSPSPFGCFTYDAPDAQAALRIHFMPEPLNRQTSPLSGRCTDQRRLELKALFMEVRRLHPDVRQVRGLSWLYHLKAYRNLFPPAYAASIEQTAGPFHLTGSSVWGQVLDYRHRLRPGMANRVLDGLRGEAIQNPWKAFPLQPLGARCAIEHFSDWYR